MSPAPPKVWYLPSESHTARVFAPETYRALAARYTWEATEGARRVTSDEVAARLAGYDALVTGWGSPPVPVEALSAATSLRLIAHSAGSVKFLLTGEAVREILLPRGITVFSANRAIALNVAEATVGYLIAFSRRWFDQIQVTRSGGWANPAIASSGQYLRGAVVGLVSASQVALEVIRLLQPFDVRILVHDPYLSDDDACGLGVDRVELDELCSVADMVSLHAPSIPATRHMIGQRQLGALRDGALLVNTARGSILDHQALLQEARRGRIQVVLDVTDPEPLPPDDPLRALPNLFITPHVSGSGRYGYLEIGEMTARALDNCFAGRPVDGAVNLGLWDRLA